jgi:hypothetical protein
VTDDVLTGPVGEQPTTHEPPTSPEEPGEAIAPRDSITCPECGTVSVVALTRRDATDFCHNCDYPLFWTPAEILHGSDRPSDDSLRRLPGTGGRVTVGSIQCPHCSEANPLSAHVCIRCGGLMNPPAPAPEPEPVALPLPPPPPPPPAPTPRTPWWVWAIGISTLLILIALIGYAIASS